MSYITAPALLPRAIMVIERPFSPLSLTSLLPSFFLAIVLNSGDPANGVLICNGMMRSTFDEHTGHIAESGSRIVKAVDDGDFPSTQVFGDRLRHAL